MALKLQPDSSGKPTNLARICIDCLALCVVPMPEHSLLHNFYRQVSCLADSFRHVGE